MKRSRNDTTVDDTDVLCDHAYKYAECLKKCSKTMRTIRETELYLLELKETLVKEEAESAQRKTELSATEDAAQFYAELTNFIDTCGSELPSVDNSIDNIDDFLKELQDTVTNT